MRIAVASVSTNEIAEYAEPAHANHKAYCERHGYAYVRGAVDPSRPASWSKIPTILAIDAEYVLWIDADAVFTNPSIRIEEIIDQSNRNLVIRSDENGVNCGVMLWKKGKWAEQVLNAAWGMTEYINHPWWEQAAFQAILAHNEQHVYHIEPQKLNAYSEEWQQGDFIFHAVGSPEHKAQRILGVLASSYDHTPTSIYSHSGDRGDLIASLAVHAHNRTPVDLCLFPSPRTGNRMTLQAAEGMIPLLEAQPYVRSAYWASTPQGVNMDVWRDNYKGGYNLADMQTEFFGCGFYPRDRAWIRVPDPKKVAKVVIQRSPRYHNWNFAEVWRNLIAEYRNEIVFVGLPHEHADFCTYIGPVAYYPTKDYLELAQVIAGACLFAGNQSSPFWVAEAYKQVVLLEASLQHRNCHFQRAGLIYGVNQYVDFPSRGDLERVKAENDARVTRDI